LKLGSRRGGVGEGSRVVYRLGVDLGTTYTAAAVSVEGTLEMLALGNRALQMPSVLFIKEDGEVLVGEAAERRGVVEPTRVVREFKRRMGDSVPLRTHIVPGPSSQIGLGHLRRQNAGFRPRLPESVVER
jgi:hypothetical protein